ncbi:MAG: lipid-binding SYLF domain-containing protein, partial [Candidatus Omnitrophota bacterium]
MRKISAFIVAIFIFSAIYPASSFSANDTSLDDNKWTKLVEESGKVLSDIQRMPDQGIPEDLLRSSQAIAIFPNTISAGFVFGGKYGQGIIMIRDINGKWS